MYTGLKKNNFDLSEIEETRNDDKSKETGENIDNTLLKYFSPEKMEKHSPRLFPLK